MIVALAGGVGGAKLADGLVRALAPEKLAVLVNTGDDFEHLGLHVSPDLDTVMYTLAGIANPETGWGRADESWHFMAALEALGGPTWFRLGDKDLATHAERTRRLRNGEPLSAVTRALCTRLGVRHAVLPMSDDPVRTHVVTDEATLDFQHYFVREQCRPRARAIEYRGAETARPCAAIERAPQGVLICPSNPYLSVAPILAIPGMRDRLRGAPAIVAVSPIVRGCALKGPAAKIMEELGLEPSPIGIARYYAGFVDVLVIDHADAALAGAIEALGVRAAASDIIMRRPADRTRLARECLRLLGEAAKP
jgi:LPPG:FO 2-phospho-L-lactate transferase